MLYALYETVVLSGPGGAVIIVRDNDYLIKARRRCGDPFGATVIQTGSMSLTQTGPRYQNRTEHNLYAAYLFPTGMPIYPSTWSDIGNPFYYIFCTYLISMNNYCYHDCLCNIYYHYFKSVFVLISVASYYGSPISL